MATQIRFYTVQEASEEIGVSSGRVRQVLADKQIQRKERIGTKHGWAWVLTDDDIGKLRKFILKNS